MGVNVMIHGISDSDTRPIAQNNEEPLRAIQGDAAKNVPQQKGDDPFGIQDEYIKGSRPAVKGIYGLKSDEHGENKISYEPPDKISDDKKVSGDEKKKYVTNTDSVDKEIERLKEMKEKIEQELRMEKDDENKKRVGEELSRIESELAMKDSEGYRRSKAKLSEE